MSCCRTCSNSIDESVAMDIFAKANRTILDQIELVTGVWLPNKRGFPVYLCSKCQRSLAQAIAFRECCIETQQRYLQHLEACKKSSSANHTQTINSALKKTEIDPLDISEDSLDAALAEDLKYSQTIGVPESSNVEISITEIDVDLKYDNHRQNDEQSNLPSVENSDEQPVILASLNEPKEANGKKTEKFIIKPNKATNRVDKKQSNGKRKKRIVKSDCCMCDICGKYFLCKRNLDLHQMRHTGVKNVQCEFCDAKFYTISLLNLHKRQHINPFKCSYCDETFGYNSSRLRHERIHRDERPFKCRFCEKSFRCSTSKKGHEVTHTRVRTFQCKVCSIWFLTNKHLNTHKRTKAHNQQVLSQGAMGNVDLMVASF